MDGDDFRIEERTACFRGFFRVDRYRLRHRLFAGGWSQSLTRELFERGDAVAVLPYDPVLDQVVLIEQFRIGAIREAAGPWLLEIVAGIIDAGEPPEAVAVREMREEAGLELRDLVPITRCLVSPGGTTEAIHLFCGWVDAQQAGGIHGLEGEGEDIRVSTLPVEQAFERVADGGINSAAPIIALQWLQLNRERLRRAWREEVSR